MFLKTAGSSSGPLPGSYDTHSENSEVGSRSLGRGVEPRFLDSVLSDLAQLEQHQLLCRIWVRDPRRIPYRLRCDGPRAVGVVLPSWRNRSCRSAHEGLGGRGTKSVG